jgi:DNA modification methylase
MNWLNQCHFGDCLETLRRMPDCLVQTCVTSPPYFGLRDYGHDGQIGLEATPDAYIAKLVEVFHEVKRVLRDDGTLWLNIGDSYAANRGYQVPDGKVGDVGNSKGSKVPDGLKVKDLIGIPWMLAFALRADGWYLRQEIIWAKPNPMPESVTDRCTKSHESIFLLAKSERYYFDASAIKEPASGWNGSQFHTGKTAEHQLGRSQDRSKRDSFKRDDSKRAEEIPGQSVGTHRTDRDESEWDTETRNKRSVWTVPTKPFSGSHFAVFPPALIEPCILAGAPAGGVVLDPFYGSGTTGQVSQALGRQFIGCELNTAYKDLQDQRTCQPSLLLEAA